MRTLLVLGLLAVAGWGHAADSRVTVSYADSEQFADFGRSKWDRERHQRDFAEALQPLSEQLPPGQTLHLRFTDVNLAGEVEWWRFQGQDIRVMRNVTWPSLRFDYEIQDASGHVVKRGEVRLADMNYLHDSVLPRHVNSATYKYEQRMLERWVRQELRP